jgi:transposase
MAHEFRPVSRDELMLLPPDLREWLPEGHLAWLVLEVVEALDLSEFERAYRRGGAGAAAYDPRMLVALVVYAYCAGIRSARALEAACVTDVACRVLAAQARPDHATIARFRTRHAAALAGLFGQVLETCAKAGLGKVGIVSIDGTKIAAMASPRANRDGERFRKMAEQILAEAAAIDAAEDEEFGDRSGSELSEEFAPGPGRAAKIRAVLDALDAEKNAETAERRAADVAAAQKALAGRERRLGHLRAAARARHEGRAGNGGRVPVEDQKSVREAREAAETAAAALDLARSGRGPKATATPDRKVNLTDPDSRPMRAANRGWIQGFNAQIAVSDDHLILAVDVLSDANDTAAFAPMMDAAVAAVAAHLPEKTIGVVLADAGYCTAAALAAPGPDRLIATGRDPGKPAKDPNRAAMAARLAEGTPGRATYKRRGATVEPVIGHLKERLGLTRFSRRGIQAARHELALAAICHNIRRLATV